MPVNQVEYDVGRLNVLRMTAVATILTLVLGLPGKPCWPEDAAPRDKVDRFDSLLRQHTRETFQVIARYVEDNPDAADVDQAYRWLMKTAQEHGLEQSALSTAEKFLKRPGLDDESRKLTEQVRCMGLARSGRMEESLAAFEDHLRSLRLRSANAAIDFALAFAVQAQLADDLGAARAVYERLSAKFFLNPQVREICESRLQKLELLGHAAPEFEATDVSGEQFRLGDYRNKVVLIDFWATNCAPCLEEFPNLKQLHAEFHKQGFEIIGISLDENRETVGKFQQHWKLPWRLVMNNETKERLRNKYVVPKIPALYLIDRQGTLAHFDVRGPDLRKTVKEMVEAR